MRKYGFLKRISQWIIAQRETKDDLALTKIVNKSSGLAELTGKIQ